MKTKLTLLILLLFAGFNGFGQGNTFPVLTGLWSNGAPCGILKINNKRVCFNDMLPIELFAGDTLDFGFIVTDPDQDSLSIISDFATVFPGSTFNVITPVPNQHYQKILQFRWIPSAVNATLAPVAGIIMVDSDSKPISTRQTLSFQIRVSNIGSITMDGKSVNITDEIDLQPGQPFNFRLSSVDPAHNNSISISSNVTTILPAATFSANTANQQTADITWTPTAADVRATPYVFTVTLRDNSVAGGKLYVYTVKLRVGNVMGATKEISKASFSSYPNPFTDQVSFRIDQAPAAESILIYNLLGQQIDRIPLQNASSSQRQAMWEKSGRFAKGTYLARLIVDGKPVQVLKFTKQ